MRTHSAIRPSAFSLARAALLAAALATAGVAALAADAPSKAAAAAPKTPSRDVPAAVDAPAAAQSTTAADTDDADADVSTATPTPKRGHHHSHIQIGDEDFDSFTQAMDQAPWIVGVIFLVLGSIFLTPILLALGIIWYKLRKTRMQNEAMLKLAERGVVPTAQALDALAAGTAPVDAMPVDATADATGGAKGASAAATAPAFQRVVASRRRAVWSDLRKGVLMIAVGLAFSFYSMTESGEANWLGLVLLFLGLGYVAIWWLEDRHLQLRQVGATDAANSKI